MRDSLTVHVRHLIMLRGRNVLQQIIEFFTGGDIETVVLPRALFAGGGRVHDGRGDYAAMRLLLQMEIWISYAD